MTGSDVIRTWGEVREGIVVHNDEIEWYTGREYSRYSDRSGI